MGFGWEKVGQLKHLDLAGLKFVMFTILLCKAARHNLSEFTESKVDFISLQTFVSLCSGFKILKTSRVLSGILVLKCKELSAL
jgi:hypothetical protein